MQANKPNKKQPPTNTLTDTLMPGLVWYPAPPPPGGGLGSGEGDGDGGDAAAAGEAGGGEALLAA